MNKRASAARLGSAVTLCSLVCVRICLSPDDGRPSAQFIIGRIMTSFAIVLLSIGLLWGTDASAEELSVPVDYRGQQIQLTGRFDKPTAQGPVPVVILLHNCAPRFGTSQSGLVTSSR